MEGVGWGRKVAEMGWLVDGSLVEWVERRVETVVEVVVEHVERGPIEESQRVAVVEFETLDGEDPLEIGPRSCWWPWWSLPAKIAKKTNRLHCLKVQDINTA